jgi:hypothetical protein
MGAVSLSADTNSFANVVAALLIFPLYPSAQSIFGFTQNLFILRTKFTFSMKRELNLCVSSNSGPLQ